MNRPPPNPILRAQQRRYGEGRGSAELWWHVWGDIARLVLFETTALGALGGVIGCLLGLVLVLGHSVGVGWLPVFDPRLVPLAIVLGLVLEGLAGLAPAANAATVEPVEALRRI